MPINTTNSQYDASVKQWQRVRDCVAGSDAIKARGTEYLPALSEQSTAEYLAYKIRAMYYNASGRTLQGLVGAIMRKEPTITVPSVLAPLVHDCTLQGIPLSSFAKLAVAEVLLTGRFGVLVDMPSADADLRRPYVVGFPAEQIINWQMEMLHGLPVVTRIVLCEFVTERDDKDPYVVNTVEQYRELFLDHGIYRQQLWRKQKHLQRGSEEWLKYEPAITPVVKGAPFKFIPFVFLSPSTITPEVERSPLLDLADVNLSHYRSSADLEHGRHYCGLPTAVVTGVSDKSTKLCIGSSIAWVLPDAQADAKFLEFTGQGLGALENAIKDKKQDMAILGARLLEAQKPSTEAADTLRTRLAGEQSILRSVALTVSAALSQCLEWAALWADVPEAAAAKATCQLNMDFIDNTMSFAELTELTKAWQSGAISYDTLYFNMQRGEVTRPGISAKKEQAQIEVESPAILPQNIDPRTGLPVLDVEE